MITIKTLKTTLISLGIAYGLVLGVLFVEQRALLYPGAADQTVVGLPETYGARAVHDFRLTAADGQELRSWFLPPATDDAPVLMMLLGNNGRLNGHMDLLKALQDKGFGALVVGYRGFNGSSGQPTEDNLYADARANLAWLNDTAGIALDQVVVMGYSLGTGIATKMATEYPLKGLVLAAPYTSMVDMARHTYWWVPVSLLLKDRYDTQSRLSDIHAPLLVIMGEKDQVVPAAQGHAVFDAAGDPKDALWLPEADHFTLFQQGGTQRIIDFMLWLN